MIQENISNVLQKISEACAKSGRNTTDVKLIAVSKTKPISDIEEAYMTGIRDFGENKVQELDQKYPALEKDINWHLIGHLQRNKVKYIIDKVSYIHSVDSLRLAEQIEEEAAKKDISVKILIEVNIADEETKFGIKPEEALDLVKAISLLKHVQIKGLMTIAPYTEDSETNRGYFKQLRNLSEDIKLQNIPGVEMKELSMGMTGDYEVAVEEGATFVRVGTGIFGNRNYNI